MWIKRFLRKIYFWDTGIRNYLIGNVNRLNQRNDTGALFENFLIAERQKWLINHRSLANSNFWRLYTGAELDYIEENQGVLTGYEIKWGKKAFVSRSPGLRPTKLMYNY